jgi:hypothetical protein
LAAEFAYQHLGESVDYGFGFNAAQLELGSLHDLFKTAR